MTNLLTILKDLDPVDVAEVREAGIPPVPSRDEFEEPLSRRTPQRRSGRRLVLAGGGLAMAASAVAFLLPSAPSGASPQAAEALAAVARVATAQASGDESNYVKLLDKELVVDGDAQYGYLVPTTVELTMTPNGTVTQRMTRGKATFVGPRDRQRWLAHGSQPPLPPAQPATTTTATAEELASTPELGVQDLPPLRSLPTDPDQLAAVLRDAAARSEQVPQAVRQFELAAEVLLYSTSPQLRKSVYTVVSKIEGVMLGREATDPRGRDAVAVAIDADYSGSPTRSTLYFDGETAQPLAETTTLLTDEPYVDGRDIGSTVFISDRRPGS